MANTVTKTRTNYFAVKDKKAFAKMVDALVSDDGKVQMNENNSGEVMFCADGAILGIKDSDIDMDSMREKLCNEIMERGMTFITNHLGISREECRNMSEDLVKESLDAKIGELSRENLLKELDEYDLYVWEPDEMETAMIKKIQDLIEPGHACIMTDVWYEKLRSVGGSSLIITSDKVEVVNLNEISLDIARKLLDNEEYDTDMDY